MRLRILLPLLLVCVPLVFLLVPFPHINASDGDAAEYNAFADNLLLGNGYSAGDIPLIHGYSAGGTQFSNDREPAYPAFLAGVYTLFGKDNFDAVHVLQLFMLGLLALIVYRTLALSGAPRAAWIAALIVALLPSYGWYANRVLTEIPFALMLGCVLYAAVRIMHRERYGTFWDWMLLGLACAVGTLVRSQILLLLPFLFVLFCIYLWYRGEALLPRWRTMGAALAVFAVIVGAWSVYVHSKIGTFSITTARPQRALYIRGVRATLSYGQLTQYAIDWAHRSIDDGYNSPFLDAYEYQQLDDIDYTKLATSSAAVAGLESQSIHNILTHPGEYLYGNLIEVMKVMWIEHDYSDFLNKYLRAGMYAFVYALFLFGLWQLWRHKDPALRMLAAVALAIIFYNIFLLTLFDTVPRYNTPLLFLYLIVGFAGVALYVRRVSLKLRQ